MTENLEVRYRSPDGAQKKRCQSAVLANPDGITKEGRIRKPSTQPHPALRPHHSARTPNRRAVQLSLPQKIKTRGTESSRKDGHPVYHSLYLIAARRFDAELLTADRRLETLFAEIT